jgi:hypothetical protein
VTAVIVAAISEGTWAFLGVLTTQIVVLVALFVRQGRNATSLEQINTAVNHQGKDEPTLVQRVVNVEQAVASAGVHRSWEKQAFTTLAHHVGCTLPPYPHHDDPTEGDHLA